MRRSAALIGQGRGPLVRVGRQKAELSIRGLLKGEQIRIRTFCEEGKLLFEHLLLRGHDDEGGFDRYELNDCFTAQVEYDGENKKFIACVLTGV